MTALLFVKEIIIIVFSDSMVKLQGEFAQPGSGAIESTSTRAWRANEESA